MSFFTSRKGNQSTGEADKAFAQSFKHLPDNTQCVAMIRSFRLEEYEDEQYYQIIYKIVDGDFKGEDVKQRIAAFDADDNKQERALNMLYRIFKLCEHKTDYDDIPTTNDVSEMCGKLVSIKIGNGIIAHEPRTWVREVHREGTIPTVTGDSPAHSQSETNNFNEPQDNKWDTSFERNRKRQDDSKYADLPF